LPPQLDASMLAAFRNFTFITEIHMGAKQETAVLNFLQQFTGGDWPDIDGLVASFALENTSYVLYPTTKPIIGRTALKEEFARQAKTSHAPRSDIKAYASNGRFVFIERVDHFITHGIQHTVAMNSVFEVNEDNLITAWREYFDSGDVARQLGIGADEMGRLLQK
jgi:limonene-1,2-epoxide hydrolase